jgi:flavin reductase (DIM6/NTAB) family NADH-FMN oxidoreductase RutF
LSWDQESSGCEVRRIVCTHAKRDRKGPRHQGSAIGANVLRASKQKSRTAPRSVHRHRGATSDRLDHVDELEGRDQSCPLFVFQQCLKRSSDDHVRQRRSKGHITFVEETGEFVCNLATWDLREAVKESSWTFPSGVNEMEAVGLEAVASLLVKPPRVKAAPCALECKWLRTVRLDDIDGKPAPRFIAFGQVIGVHIDERFIRDGLVDTAAMKPIMRAGYHDYFFVSEDSRFSMRHFKRQRPRIEGIDQ